MRAAHLEQIGEIGGEGDSDLNAAPPVIEIANAQPFEAARPPQKPRPSQMDEVVLDLQAVRSSNRSGLVRSQVSVALSSRRVELRSIGRAPSTVTAKCERWRVSR